MARFGKRVHCSVLVPCGESKRLHHHCWRHHANSSANNYSWSWLEVGYQLLAPSRLVKLLEHLHIIAPLEEEEDGERKYFMPCVLAHTRPVEPATTRFKRAYRAIKAFFVPSNPSLLIGFNCGYCPKGLFAALVVYLLANTKWRLQRERIFRNQISFSVGPYDTMSITVQPKFLEITCKPASSELTHNRHFPPYTYFKSITSLCNPWYGKYNRWYVTPTCNGTCILCKKDSCAKTSLTTPWVLWDLHHYLDSTHYGWMMRYYNYFMSLHQWQWVSHAL